MFMVRLTDAAYPFLLRKYLESRPGACPGAGGVGTEELMYPEYCRALLDAAPAGFDQAMFRWEQLYKPVRPAALALLPSPNGNDSRVL